MEPGTCLSWIDRAEGQREGASTVNEPGSAVRTVCKLLRQTEQ